MFGSTGVFCVRFFVVMPLLTMYTDFQRKGYVFSAFISIFFRLKIN